MNVRPWINQFRERAVRIKPERVLALVDARGSVDARELAETLDPDCIGYHRETARRRAHAQLQSLERAGFLRSSEESIAGGTRTHRFRRAEAPPAS